MGLYTRIHTTAKILFQWLLLLRFRLSHYYCQLYFTIVENTNARKIVQRKLTFEKLSAQIKNGNIKRISCSKAVVIKIGQIYSRL